MFNSQRYMHITDAYFAPSTIRFPYELKKIFDQIFHELQYSFPVTNVELQYMFDTLGFYGFTVIVLHICYISWRSLLMDYPMIVSRAQLLLYKGCDWYQSIIRLRTTNRYRCVMGYSKVRTLRYMEMRLL